MRARAIEKERFNKVELKKTGGGMPESKSYELWMEELFSFIKKSRTYRPGAKNSILWFVSKPNFFKAPKAVGNTRFSWGSSLAWKWAKNKIDQTLRRWNRFNSLFFWRQRVILECFLNLYAVSLKYLWIFLNEKIIWVKIKITILPSFTIFNRHFDIYKLLSPLMYLQKKGY